MNWSTPSLLLLSLSSMSLFPFLLSLIPSISPLICYHCMSPLSSDIPLEGQLTLKSLLYSAYNVPPVQQVCAMEDDPEFRALETIECNDTCVEIQIEHGDTTLMLRGCNGSLFLRGYHLSPDAVCSPSSTPSICACSDRDLCNSMSVPSLFPLFLLSLVFYL